MARHPRSPSFVVLLALLFVAFVGVLRAAIDRTPNNTTGAIYKVTPSVLVDGDYDSLHMDVNHGLLVSPSGPMPPPSGASAATPFGTVLSNGVTPVTLVAATPAKVIVVYSYTFSNTDSVAHQVDVTTSTGGAPVVWHFVLAATSGAGIYDGSAAAYSHRTISGDSLRFSLPNFVAEGGVANTVAANGWTFKQ